MSIKKVLTKNQSIRWEVVTYTGGRGSQRIVRRFDKRAEAEAFLHEYRTRKKELKHGRPDVRDFEETTFQEEADYWLSQRKHILSPGHLKRAEGVLKELKPQLGGLRPNRITPHLLTTIQADQIAGGWSADTANRKIEIITSILNLSVKHRRIPYNPAAGYEKMKVTREEMICWELEEVQSFLAFADSKYPSESLDRWKYIVYLLAINSGLRAGEIWGLKRYDLIQSDEILLIQRQFDRNKKAYRPTKGKKNRRVPCNNDLRSEIYAMCEERRIAADDPLFFSESRTPIDHDNFKNRTFTSDLEEWGGRKIRFHDLRHIAITLMVASGIDLKTVQEIAGHQDIKTTMGYTHRVAEKVREVARSFVIRPMPRQVTNQQEPKQLIDRERKTNLRLVVCKI